MKAKSKIKYVKSDDPHDGRIAQIPVWLSEDSVAEFQKTADEHYSNVPGNIGVAIREAAIGKVFLDAVTANLAEPPRHKIRPTILTLRCLSGDCFDEKGNYSVARLVGLHEDYINWNGTPVHCVHYRCDECGLQFLDEHQIERFETGLHYRYNIIEIIPRPQSGWLFVKSSVDKAAKKRETNRRKYEAKR
jgi:hypothetical protein